MVIFALTRSGFDEMEPTARERRAALWVNAGVLSDGEAARLRQDGLDLTVFAHAIDPADGDALESALATIAEHHPEERIWLETSAGGFGTRD